MTTRLVEKWKTQIVAVNDNNDDSNSTTEECKNHSNTVSPTALPVLNDLTLMAADTIATVALGYDLDFLRHPDAHFLADVQHCLSTLGGRTLAYPFCYWKIPVIGQYLDGRGWAIRRVQTIIAKAIEEQERAVPKEQQQNVDKCRAKDDKSNHQSSGSTATFLSKLLRGMRAEKIVLERDRLAGNVLTLFLGGTDTSSKTLSHALYILAQQPVLQQQLRVEADRAGADFLLDHRNLTLPKLLAQFPRTAVHQKTTRRTRKTWVH
jgi:cytochrome P450